MNLTKNQIFIVSIAVIVLCVALIILFFPKNKIDSPLNGTNGVPSFALNSYWTGTNGQTVKALAEDVSNIYAAAGYDGLLVIRKSDMSNIASFATNQPVNDAVLKIISTNKYVFLPLGTYNGSGGFMSLNVSDLSNIFVTHYYTEPTRSASAIDYVLTRNGVKIVTADDFQGYQAYQIDWSSSAVTPDKPVPLGAKSAVDIFVNGTVGYIAAKDEGVFIIDAITGRILYHLKPALSLANSVFVKGRILLVSDKMNGIMIYDISNPSSPVQLAVYDTPGDANNAILVNDMIYIADGINGVMKVKWTQPNKFTLQKIYNDGSLAYQVLVDPDNKVYVAAGSAGLKVLIETNIPIPEIVSNQSVSNQGPGTNNNQIMLNPTPTTNSLRQTNLPRVVPSTNRRQR